VKIFEIMSGMYEVTWPEFSSNRTSYLYEQVKQNNFVDVTIVFDDEEMSAHKVVLASSSSFFQRVLERSTHPNPMLYLKGVEKRLFSHLLEFIYLGEVSLPDADFDKFLQMARDLKIKGLLMENPGVEEIDQGSYALEDESVTLKDDSYIDNQETPKKQEQRKSIDTPFVALKERSDSKVIKEDKSYSKVMKEDKSYSRVLKEERSYQSIISEEKIDEETGDYDLSDPVSAEIYAKVSALLVTTPEGFWVCNECRYGSKSKVNVMEHAEGHIQGVVHKCKQCNKVFTKKQTLRTHRNKCSAAKQNK